MIIRTIGRGGKEVTKSLYQPYLTNIFELFFKDVFLKFWSTPYKNIMKILNLFFQIKKNIYLLIIKKTIQYKLYLMYLSLGYCQGRGGKKQNSFFKSSFWNIKSISITNLQFINEFIWIHIVLNFIVFFPICGPIIQNYRKIE